jgi:hypothetical protein
MERNPLSVWQYVVWRRFSLGALIILSSVAFTGCSRLPSASNAEQIIRDSIAQNAGGRIQLLSFQKTNGTQGEFMGVKMYAMEIAFEIEFTENCKWLAGGLGHQLTLATSLQAGPQGGTMMQLLEQVGNPGSFVRKGQRYRITGIQRYAKKDSGWTAAGLELQNAAPLNSPEVSQNQGIQIKSAGGKVFDLPQQFPTNQGPVAIRSTPVASEHSSPAVRAVEPPKPPTPDIIEEQIQKEDYPYANASIPDSFEAAEAWNIRVEKVQTIVDLIGTPSFSPDYQNIAFTRNRDAQMEIAILSINKREIIRRIPLPLVTQDQKHITYSPREARVTYSVDAKKMVYGPISLDDGRSRFGLIFVDLQTGKIITVDFPHEISWGGPGSIGIVVLWPKADTIYISRIGGFGYERVNLDTLQIQQRENPSPEEWKLEQQQVTTHKNFVLQSGENGLQVAGRKTPYSRVLFSGTARHWTPDARYVLSETREEGMRLLTLGLRPSPVLDFELKGISDQKIAEMQNYTNAGAQIWASIYGNRVNPLTDRVIGPNKEDYHGQGYLTQLSPVVRFRFSVEQRSAEVGNVASDFLVPEGWKSGRIGQRWVDLIWAELMPVGNAVAAAKPETAKTESPSEDNRNPEQTESTGAGQTEAGREDLEHKEIVAIIEKAISAMGGKDTINRFRFSKTITESKGKKQGVEFLNRVTAYAWFPDKVRIDQEVTVKGRKPFQDIVCISEMGSWEVAQGVLHQPLPPNTRELLREALYIEECETLVPLLGSDYTLEKLTNLSNSPDGAVAIRVRKASKHDLILYFDKTSGLMVGSDSEGADETGRLFRASNRITEFGNFSGLILPTVSRYVRDDNTTSDTRLQLCASLSQASVDVFDMPAVQRR